MIREEQQAAALAQWLDGPAGTAPPEDLDAEVGAAVYALRPERAPAPRVTAQELLDAIEDGPLAAFDADELRAASRLAAWLGAAPAGAPDADADGVLALRPDLAPPPAVDLDALLDSVETGPLAAPATVDAQRLQEHLAGRGEAPADALPALDALRPDRAPAPRLTADDILAAVQSGPLAAPAPPTALVDAPEIPTPANRPRRWGWGIFGTALAAAAALLIVPLTFTQTADEAPVASAPTATEADGAPNEDVRAADREAPRRSASSSRPAPAASPEPEVVAQAPAREPAPAKPIGGLLGGATGSGTAAGPKAADVIAEVAGAEAPAQEDFGGEVIADLAEATEDTGAYELAIVRGSSSTRAPTGAGAPFEPEEPEAEPQEAFGAEGALASADAPPDVADASRDRLGSVTGGDWDGVADADAAKDVAGAAADAWDVQLAGELDDSVEEAAVEVNSRKQKQSSGRSGGGAAAPAGMPPPPPPPPGVSAGAFAAETRSVTPHQDGVVSGSRPAVPANAPALTALDPEVRAAVEAAWADASRLAASGEPEAAVAVLLPWVAGAPDPAVAHWSAWLGTRLLLDAGRGELAAAVAEQGLAIATPTSQRAALGVLYGDALASIGELRRAESAYEAVAPP